MNKTLKFAHSSVPAMLKNGNITTRLFDEKNISTGDTLDFQYENSETFATAKITKVWETAFEDMVKDSVDRQGMYDLYEGYYQRKIEPQDKVKWIEFEFLNKNKDVLDSYIKQGKL